MFVNALSKSPLVILLATKGISALIVPSILVATIVTLSIPVDVITILLSTPNAKSFATVLILAILSAAIFTSSMLLLTTPTSSKFSPTACTLAMLPATRFTSIEFSATVFTTSILSITDCISAMLLVIAIPDVTIVSIFITNEGMTLYGLSISASTVYNCDPSILISNVNPLIR